MALYGIYGSHTVEACPVNDVAMAKKLVAVAESDLSAILAKYRINKILGQYHSAFEHTFVWIVDADDPHQIEGFAMETGLVAFNMLKIVPLKSLQDDVIPMLKEMHGL